VCKQTVKNGLRWRKAPTTTTTTTTSVAPSTTVAVVPTVSLAATFIDSGKFPKAAVVTANVAGTVYLIEGASPVSTVSDITSARYYRWTSGVVTANTPTSIALDVDVLTNGYYRVFVASSQGVLSAPAFNKVTISISRVSDVAALTCATGGTCAVGETGPGGGKVFYAAAGTFASPGSPCNTAGVGGISTCKYLEAAPTTGGSAWTDVTRTWSTGSNQLVVVPGAYGEAIGTGYQNTLEIIAQSGNVAATSAAVAAQAYRGPNSLSDWFLPSRYELNELCKYAKNTGQASGGGTVCTGGSEATGRGFLASVYWGSSEVINDTAAAQSFGDGFRGNSAKINSWYVRPVRAF